jgi:ADP-ribose pyrophosphatase YjhB (NUDIX family)
MWTGSAAICRNEQNQILMVLQGKPDEEKRWSVPSGGKETDETYEDCCAREVWEETGYRVKVGKKLFEKKGVSYDMEYTAHYFEVTLEGGEATIQDPDGLIHDIRWMSMDEVKRLNLSFPEDREYLIEYLQNGFRFSDTGL